MTSNAFQVAGESLFGHGLSFDVTGLVGNDVVEGSRRLAEIAEVAFRQGRASALLSWDDRFDLHASVDVLRAVAVIVGPIAGERHCRAASIIARLLLDQESGK